MSIKDTVKHLKDLLARITVDLEKADGGNKAASQRVRTGTVKLEKLAKVYRKESISTERKPKGHKKPAKAAKKAHKPAHKAAHKAHKPAHKAHHKAKKATVKAKPKAKTAHASFRPRQLTVKRASARIPTKRKRASFSR